MKIKKRNTRILMVGPSIQSKGGIAQVLNDYHTSNILSNYDISYISTYSEGTKRYKVFYFFKGLFQLIRRIAYYDIIHIHTSYGWSFRRLFLVFIIARWYCKKTVLHIHGSRFDIWYLNIFSFEKYIAKYVLRSSDAVIALSKEWQFKLSSIEPSAKIKIIENTINTNNFPKRSLNDLPSIPYKLLFLGKLGKRKGVYDIIKASTLLAPKKYEIYIAGDGEIEEVKKFIIKQSVNVNIHVTGWISGQDKKNMLKQADLLLLPSYHEGLPISILEGMATGLPIIATPVGGIPQVVKNGENGYLVNCGDYKGLADAIENIFSESLKWKEFAKRSRKTVEKYYGMQRAEQMISKLYNSIL